MIFNTSVWYNADMTKYNEITCKTACHKIDGFLPYEWDLNIYRGCGHHCKYCFALYSHKYMNSVNFFDEIFVKTNIAESLEKQLSSKNWKREVINLGGVTDSYQPAEEKYKLMPEILKVLIKYKTPVTISTKSKLILRDYDLIDELSKVASVNIACTITTINETVRELIEPNTSLSSERFEVLKEFSKTNASTGVHMMPVIPYLTDTYQNLDGLFMNAQKCGACYVITDILNLRGQTRKVFFEFIKNKLPHLYGKISALYRNYFVDKEFRMQFKEKSKQLRIKYPLKNKRKIFVNQELEHLPQQLSFF
ncbi:MAG: radical SAM protein [Endomicrobiaceae bacterium]|nr:radical SAM protein [Endomicrobiaceae bacterium]MDD4166179.1 radical SAM protein [Endomicrobiaceae bacterium]